MIIDDEDELDEEEFWDDEDPLPPSVPIRYIPIDMDQVPF
jgi:hypothetical protein